MKKDRNNSARASALQIGLSIAVTLMSAVLLTSTFKAAPAASGLVAPIAPGAGGDKDLAIPGPASVSSLSPLDLPFTFAYTPSLNTARSEHTATLLPNGKVLVAGGQNSFMGLTSAELYDPASGTWSATGSLNTARYSHTATLLPNGKALVAGGRNDNHLSSAELYDPSSGTWSATGCLNNQRELHTAKLLPNGKALVAGE